MHLVLTGATGMVGSATLHAMVRNPAVSHISILSRRPVPQATDTPEASSKCTVHIHKDFAEPPSADVLATLADARGVVWAQGISQTQVSRDQYEAITYEYPLTFARALTSAREQQQQQQQQAPVNFVYVSGEGATTNPGRFSQTFAVVKGRAEAALLQLSKESNTDGKLNVYSARPGGVDVTYHPEIQQYWKDRLPWYKELAYKPMLAVFRVVYKPMISPTRELGDALVKLASGDGKPLPVSDPGISGEGRTLNNAALRRLVGI